MSSGGAHPCYVSVNEDGLVLLPIIPEERCPDAHRTYRELSEVLSADQHTGHGPVADRQEKPHVHSAIFEPKGKRIFVADLGIDQVKVYTIDKNHHYIKTQQISGN